MQPDATAHCSVPFVPQQLIDERGRVTQGIFPASVPRINGRAADYRTAMGRPASRLARHFHYKQFQYFGIVSDQVLAGCALANTAWLGIAFFYIFEPRSGRLEEYTWRSPLAHSLSLSDSPVQGRSHFRRGKVDIAMGYHRTTEGLLEKQLQLTMPGTRLNATLHEQPSYMPMSLCTRTGINGWVYANKVAGVPVTGTLERPDGAISLTGAEACGHHDFSAGYMRRQTYWNWACLSARTADGTLVGINLSCGVNETSYTENCIWVNGELHKVDTVAFEYDADNLLSSWRITSYDGQVSLRFTADGRHREHMNLGLFASRFTQLFGRFEGKLALSGGRTLEIESLYGFVEEQYAKW